MSERPGDRFGKLTLVRYLAGNQRKKPRWFCKCDCGATTSAILYSLRSGKAKSCGCHRNEEKHGHCAGSEHPLYRTWVCMKSRCYRPKTDSYPLYGGRGITVCDRWRHSFASFIADMGERPTGATLDRVDNNGDYGPDNCRWATLSEQSRNNRNAKNITHDGETMCAEAWAVKKGINPMTLRGRLSRGWSVADALESPVRQGLHYAYRRKAS